MGDHRHVLAELKAGGADRAKDAERDHHRRGENRRRPRPRGEEPLRQAKADIVRHDAFANQLLVDRDAALGQRTAETAIALRRVGEPGVAVDQRDARMTEVEKMLGRVVKPAFVVDVEPGVRRLLDRPAVQDERDAESAERADPWSEMSGLESTNPSTRLLVTIRR